jgi:hypothetical protein
LHAAAHSFFSLGVGSFAAAQVAHLVMSPHSLMIFGAGGSGTGLSAADFVAAPAAGSANAKRGAQRHDECGETSGAGSVEIHGLTFFGDDELLSRSLQERLLVA